MQDAAQSRVGIAAALQLAVQALGPQLTSIPVQPLPQSTSQGPSAHASVLSRQPMTPSHTTWQA